MVLKVLGATRAGGFSSPLICEFGLIGAATALFGVVAGSAAALAVVRLVMKLDFVWLWPQALGCGGRRALSPRLLSGLSAHGGFWA